MVFWDTETALITEFEPAPSLACVSFDDGTLLDAVAGRCRMIELLNGSEVLCGHNTAYDWSVMAFGEPWHSSSPAEFRYLVPSIIAAYTAGRIRDTQVRQTILDFEAGTLGDKKLSLKNLCQRHLHTAMKKDQWRLGYASLKDVPVEEWPAGAKDYAIRDAQVTRDVYYKQGIVDGLNGSHHTLGALVLSWLLSPQLSRTFIGFDVKGEIRSKYEKLYQDFLKRGIQTDLPRCQSKPFMKYLYRVRERIGKEVESWGPWS